MAQAIVETKRHDVGNDTEFIVHAFDKSDACNTKKFNTHEEVSDFVDENALQYHHIEVNEVDRFK